MSDLFDIEFVTKSFSTCRLRHYLELLVNASTQDLRQFRKKVQAHAKQSHTSLAFSNTPWLTCHEAIVAAIDQQLLRRSPLRFKLWSLVLPARKFLVAKFSGMDLETHEFFGAVYSTPRHRRSVWHMPHKEIAAVLGRFIAEHQSALVAAVLSVIVAAIIKWFAL